MRSTFGKIFQKSLTEAVSVRDCLIPLSKREERARFGRGKAATFYAQGGMPKRPLLFSFPPITVIHSYPQPVAFLMPAESSERWDLSPLRDNNALERLVSASATCRFTGLSQMP